MASQFAPKMRAPYATRTYVATYRAESANYCPGCGQSQWLVGRVSAECARCGTALPLAESVQTMAPAPVFTATERRSQVRAV